jgi:hypothetical protein
VDELELGLRLPSWREGTVKQGLVEFLLKVTSGPDARPVAERVAAFDYDGTVACEKPWTVLAAFLAARLGEVAPTITGGHQVLPALGEVFAGTSVREYQGWAREFLEVARHPRFGRDFRWLMYRPMLELVTVLQDLSFRVFLCTDSSRDFLRVLAGPVCGLPGEQIIGSEVQITWIGGMLVRSATTLPMDDGPGKPIHLWDRIGTLPLLAAGNAGGDIEMLTCASYALVIDHDDPDREYRYQDQQVLAAAADREWTVVSMRHDFGCLWPAAPASHLR